FFQPRQRMVRGIGLNIRLQQLCAAFVVNTVYRLRVTLEPLRGGDIFYPVALPQAIGAAKCANAGFCGNPRPCQYHDTHLVSLRSLRQNTASARFKGFYHMYWPVAKVLISACLIAFASWLSNKKPELAGFIIALPLTSLLALGFSYA